MAARPAINAEPENPVCRRSNHHRSRFMPSFEQHCAESIVLFSHPYGDVHKWLDEFAGLPPYGMKHRKLRHHLAGIEEVRRRWGDDAAAAARQHIISDLKMEGWTEDQPFPKNETHYVKMGLF